MSDQPQEPPQEPPATPPDSPGEPAPPDDDIEAIRAERDRLRTTVTAERTKSKGLEADLSKMRNAQLGESERAIAEARLAGRTEALAEANRRVLRSEARALAAERTIDADTTLRMLDLDAFDVDDDGNVDRKAITAAIDELVKEKTFLAKPEVPRPNGAQPKPPQGTRGVPGSPAGGAVADDWLRQTLRPSAR